MILRRLSASSVQQQTCGAVDADALAVVAPIVAEVRREGETALRRHARRLDGDDPDGPNGPIVLDRAELLAARDRIPREPRDLLERTAARIRAFAQAQRDALRDIDVPIAGGAAGHRFEPLQRAGCYAPGGRHPLPSSVLMTVIPARVAGVREVVVATPRPAPVMLAAAAIAGADALLVAGGAQAIAALAYGAGSVRRCDVIVGPGNRYVTAAKQIVAADVAIDFLAGPSELLILADDSADASLVAADLLAQAEHDSDARPMLIATDEAIVAAVERELELQLETLPEAATAREALANGFAVVSSDRDESVALAQAIAPEHLHLQRRDARELAPRFTRAGTLFIGEDSAEALGDYGAGPNHVLPTGGAARGNAGLSVLTFLRARTWMRIDDAASARELVRDAVALARTEGLEGHARSAARRERTSDRETKDAARDKRLASR